MFVTVDPMVGYNPLSPQPSRPLRRRLIELSYQLTVEPRTCAPILDPVPTGDPFETSLPVPIFASLASLSLVESAELATPASVDL